MAAANPAGIVALHNPGAQLVAIIKTKDGTTVVRNLTADEFSKGFAEKKVLKEDMYAPEVKVVWRFCDGLGPVRFLCRGQDLALRRKFISLGPHGRGLEDRRDRFDHRCGRLHRGRKEREK